ncbi:MAG: MFS transporter [Thermoproteus sp.]
MAEPNYRLIVLLGLTSLFADWLYEGARAALPQYLKALGASALAVGLVFGVGDALGYLLRFATGPLADRRGGYWGETFAGYALQVLAVAGLALAPWFAAAVALVMLERASKALRTPARDAIISAAGGGRQSFAFGLHASLDQIGAVAGSATALAALAAGMRYGDLFLLLAVPGVAALIALFAAYRQGVRPAGRRRGEAGVSLDRPLLLFSLSQLLFGASLMHISLEMYQAQGAPWVGSAIYLAAMIFEIPASLAWGRAYEVRRWALYLGPVAALAATSAFSTGLLALGFAGALAYSAATSYADIVAKARAVELGGSAKATALGAVNAAFGLGYLAGGAIYGYLLDVGAAGVAPLISAAFAAASLALMRAAR